METRVDTVIFSVKIDNTEAVKQAAEMSKEIDELISKQQELVQQGEKNSTLYVENASALRILKKEQSDLNRSIDNSAKAFLNASGSINQMRANLSNMTQQYNKLSKEERENAEVGGKLQKQMKAVSDELKKQEGAVGDNRRSVGGYTTALNLFGEKFKLFGVDLNSIKDKLKATKEGFDTAKSGFSSFDGIIKTSAIGVLLTIVTSLIAVFSKFEPVVEKVEQAFAGLKAAFDVFVGALIEFGNGYLKVIVGYFNGLYEIMQGLGKFMTGDFSAGIEQMSNSMNGAIEGINQMRGAFDGVGGAMASAAQEAAALTARFQELEDAERALIVSNAEAAKNIDQLILKSKNRTLSEKERLGFLAQASKIEREQYAEQKRIAEEGYQIAFEQARLKTKLSKDELNQLILNTGNEEVLSKKRLSLGDDELKKLAELQAAKINLESESINVEEKITNRRDALIQQGIENRAKEVAELEKATKKLNDMFKSLLDDFDKQADEQTKSYFEDLNKRREQAHKDSENYYAAQQTALVDSYSQNLISTEQYNAALEQMELDKLEKEKANLITNFEDTTQIDLAIAQKRLEIKKASTESIVSLDKVEMQSKQQLVQTAMGLVNDLSSSLQAGKEAQKAIALANAGINLGTAIGNLVAATSAPSADNLLTGGLAGAAKFGVLVAQAISSMGSAVATISAAAGGGTFYTTKPTLLMVGDNPSGRERVTVEPLGSRGKTVFNKNSGLVKMAGGGTLISDGGATFDRVASAGNSMFDMQQLIKSMPAPIVKVVDINRVQKNKARVAKVSELN